MRANEAELVVLKIERDERRDHDERERGTALQRSPGESKVVHRMSG